MHARTWYCMQKQRRAVQNVVVVVVAVDVADVVVALRVLLQNCSSIPCARAV